MKLHYFVLLMTLIGTSALAEPSRTTGRIIAPFGSTRIQLPAPKASGSGSLLAGLYEKKYHSGVVMVANLDGSSGTGFFITHNNKVYLVTAAHVCGTAKTMYSEKGMHEVLVRAPERDTCILSTYQDVTTVELAASNIKKGQTVTTIGFPHRLAWDYRKGKADIIDMSFFPFPLAFYGGCPSVGGTELIDPFGGTVCGIGVTTIKVKMLVRPGNSGGPAFNARGEIVGIVIATDNNGHGFIVPVSELREVLSRVGN